MLKAQSFGQLKMLLLPYLELYDILIPEYHEFRRLLALINFTFIDDLI